MTVAKSQAKVSVPKFNALEIEDHYCQMQADIRATSRKIPILQASLCGFESTSKLQLK
jgi:hypothetical protein